MDLGGIEYAAVLIGSEGGEAARIQRLVASGRYGDVWLRISPLAAVGLTQVELYDSHGASRIDPALVHALSMGERRAAFVQLTASRRQGVLHAFSDGHEEEGWMGPLEELAPKFMVRLGRPLDAVLAAVGAPDGASTTAALVRGRMLAIPTGLGPGSGSFAFCDLGADPAVRDRVALVAFDGEAVRALWQTATGRDLAERVRALPRGLLGPLAGVQEEAAGALETVGDETPEAAGLASGVAFELLTLAETYLFSAGEAVTFVDQRFLPLFSLAGDEPALDSEELRELDGLASVLHAMVEVLPYASPEGSLLEQLGDDELRPLAPWAKPGEAYSGSLFALRSGRLAGLLETDAPVLAAKVDRFYRAWWRLDGAARGVAFEAWRDERDGRGAADIQRWLTSWGTWRALLGVARANGLESAILFYELDFAEENAS